MNPNNNNNGQDNAPVEWPIRNEARAIAPTSTAEWIWDMEHQETRMARRLRQRIVTWDGRHPIKKFAGFRVIQFNERLQITDKGIPINWEDCPSTVARRQYFEAQGMESMNLFMCLSAFMNPDGNMINPQHWDMIRDGLARGSTERQEGMAWILIMCEWNTNMEVLNAMEQLELRELEATLIGARKVPTTKPWQNQRVQMYGGMNAIHEVTLHEKDADTWERLATEIMMKYLHRRRYLAHLHSRCRETVQYFMLNTGHAEEMMFAIKQGVYMVAAMHYKGIPEMKRRVATVWTDMMNRMGQPIGTRERMKEILEAQLEAAPEFAEDLAFLDMPAISLPAYYGGVVRGQVALPEHVAAMLHFEKYVVSEHDWEGVNITHGQRIFPLQLWSRRQLRMEAWRFKLQLRVREELKGLFGWRLINGTYYKVTVKVVTGIDPIDALPELLLQKPTYSCQQDGSGYNETALLEIIAQNQATSRILTERAGLRVSANVKFQSIRAQQHQQNLHPRDQWDVITDLTTFLHQHEDAITDDMKAAMGIRYQNGMNLLRALSSIQRHWASFVKSETFGNGMEKDTMVRFIRRLTDQRAYLLVAVPPLTAAKIALGGKVVRFLREQGHNTGEEAIGYAAEWNLEEMEELLEEEEEKDQEEEEDPDFDERAEDDSELEDNEDEEEDEVSNYEGMDPDEIEEWEHERDVVVPFLRQWNQDG